ncbi:MAG: L-rhamnose mutarotase [Actinomycetia bacterium]|nr:L-rhamnose mutarotase [Actinomycetes bacterium]
MKRVGFVTRVAPEHLEEYKARHRKVWPEMQEALRRAGWGNYSLFLAEDGTLFGYVETPEGLDAAREAMALEEVNARWQQSVAHLFAGEQAGDTSFVELEEVFHLD